MNKNIKPYDDTGKDGIGDVVESVNDKEFGLGMTRINDVGNGMEPNGELFCISLCVSLCISFCESACSSSSTGGGSASMEFEEEIIL